MIRIAGAAGVLGAAAARQYCGQVRHAQHTTARVSVQFRNNPPDMNICGHEWGHSPDPTQVLLVLVLSIENNIEPSNAVLL